MFRKTQRLSEEDKAEIIDEVTRALNNYVKDNVILSAVVKAEKQLENYITTEHFIDALVDKIKRKQL